MKQISQYKFSQVYDYSDPNAIVRLGEKRYITDDLYIIRSSHKVRNYNYRSDGSGEQEFKFYPCWKLMSKSYNQYREENGEYQMCIMSWVGQRLFQFRRDAYRNYGPSSSSRYIHTNAVFDWIYYTLNPVDLHHANGNLKRGFRNHLITRLNGFGSDSPITIHMLETLQSDIRLGKITEYLVSPTTDSLIHKVQAYLLNNGDVKECPLTSTILPKSHMQWQRISGRTEYVKYGLNMADYGYHQEDSHWLKDNEIMIDGTCYDSNTVEITRCESCNSRCVVEETRDYQCVDCLGQNYRINNYSHRVEDSLGFDRKNKPKSEPYMGVELEFQVDKPKQGRLYTGDKLQDHALMKDDGSIRNGFEIVTRPSGYFQHISKLGSFLDDLPEYIHPHTSCGMHVHISRTAFTWLGAGKFTEFFNRVDNKKFIRLIAGRGSNNYSEQSQDMDIKSPYKSRENRGYIPRYNFVNLNNAKTIELRIFATPANRLEFEIRMQFVKAMVEYCKPAQHTVSLKEQTHYETFMNWLNSNVDNSYTKLNNFIKESAICV